MPRKISELSDGEKAGLGLVALLFGNKVLNAAARAFMFLVGLGLFIGIMAFIVIMMFVTGEI